MEWGSGNGKGAVLPSSPCSQVPFPEKERRETRRETPLQMDQTDSRRRPLMHFLYALHDVHTEAYKSGNSVEGQVTILLNYLLLLTVQKGCGKSSNLLAIMLGTCLSIKLKMNITVTIPSTVTCACTLRPCICTSCPNCYLPVGHGLEYLQLSFRYSVTHTVGQTFSAELSFRQNEASDLT